MRTALLALAGLLSLATAASADAQAPAPAYVSGSPVLRADQVDILRRALDAAPSHGLPAAAFVAPDLDRRLNAADPAVRLDAQRTLTAGAIRYAQAVHGGRLAPGDFLADWSLRPAAYDAAADYQAAVAQDRLAAWIDGLAPPYAGYAALQQGLAAYRRIEATGGWPALPAGPALKPGAVDGRVRTLRMRLAAEDPAVNATGDTAFDAALTQAVMRAQKRFGLAPTGVVDVATRQALNVPVAARIGQIEANMERWRWLPAVLPADRIQVNIAAAVLTVYRDDQPALSMRAVTGSPVNKTPMLGSVIHSVVLNPPWNVPSGIAAKELWPKGQAYLARNGFTVIPTEGGGYRLQQKAGPQSALGRFKFDFDNPFAVYLHDTPAKAAFERYERLSSHGCVRLERAEDVARVVLQGDPAWTPAVIDRALEDGRTVRAPLRRPVSVFLLYWTAYQGPDGQMNFRADSYGWDRELLKRLGAAA